MHLVFDIFQGMGIAAAAGIRPFFPTLAVGALAAGDVEIDFNHTSYSFLQSVPFLLAIAAAGIVLLFTEWRLDRDVVQEGPFALVIAASAAAVGALMFAGSLARGHYAAWPGLVGGVACASLAIAATWPLFGRVRARLSGDVGDAVPLYAEVIAVLFAGLSVVAPPLGLLGLLALVWLLVAARGRGERKYAGLRILR